MNITRNNYESWFIDYIDGTLTAEQQAELLLFLEQHPDLKAEFHDFVSEMPPQLPLPPSLPDTFLSSLKRGEVNEQNLDYHLIASLEGDLRAEEQNKLDAFLKENPHLQRQQKLVAATRLEPVEEIYPGKANLKKPVPMVFNFTRTIKYAIAAMLLLTVVAGSYVIYTKTVSTNNVHFAEGQEEMSQEGQERQERQENQEENGLEALPQIAPDAKEKSLKETDGLYAQSQGKYQGGNMKRERREKLHDTNEQQPQQPLPSQPLPSEQPKPDENLAIQSPATAPATATNPATAPATADSPVAANEEYVSVWDAIRGSAEQKANEFAGRQESVAATVGGSRNKRNLLIDLIGKGVEKITKEKVQYNTSYDENGNLSALNVNAGKFGIEKVAE